MSETNKKFKGRWVCNCGYKSHFKELTMNDILLRSGKKSCPRRNCTSYFLEFVTVKQNNQNKNNKSSKKIEEKTEKKELTAKEELEDMGIEIYEYHGEDGEESIIKIPIWVQFYEDGSWAVDSTDDMGGANRTLETGENLVDILPILRSIRDVFLKTLKEEELK